MEYKAGTVRSALSTSCHFPCGGAGADKDCVNMPQACCEVSCLCAFQCHEASMPAVCSCSVAVTQRIVTGSSNALQEVIVTADYAAKGTATLIACSYAKIADDLKPGSQILCADGSLVLRVEECKPAEKCVRCIAVNTATIGCVLPLLC